MATLMAASSNITAPTQYLRVENETQDSHNVERIVSLIGPRGCKGPNRRLPCPGSLHRPEGIFDSRLSPTGEGNPMIAIRKEYEATGGSFVLHASGAELAPGIYFTGPSEGDFATTFFDLR